jgi:hypothetical protein
MCQRSGLCAAVYAEWKHYLSLAFMIQDSCVEVRSQVADRMYQVAIRPLRRSVNHKVRVRAAHSSLFDAPSSNAAR